MTPDEYFTKYAGQAPVNTSVSTSPLVDVTNDVPLEARAVPSPTDKVKTVKPNEALASVTPQSYYAKYVMPSVDDSRGGLPPINVNNAQSLQQNDKNQYAGLCQRFVEDVTYGRHGIFDSAIDAWNKLPNKVQGLNGIKPGDLVYFSPNAGNNNDGHVGIYEGNGIFKSATSQGIEDYNIGDWMKRTGQNVLGYVRIS